MLHSKIRKSIRIPRRLQPVVGREIVRLSLNPLLYSRSGRFVRWTRDAEGELAPQEVVLRALQNFPDLPLSIAVEAVLVHLLDEAAADAKAWLSPEEQKLVRRFASLPLFEKIQVTLNKVRTYRYLKSLPWKNRAS